MLLIAAHCAVGCWYFGSVFLSRFSQHSVHRVGGQAISAYRERGSEWASSGYGAQRAMMQRLDLSSRLLVTCLWAVYSEIVSIIERGGSTEWALLLPSKRHAFHFEDVIHSTRF